MTWDEILDETPELAGFVQTRIEAHGLALLATSRRDGGPRLSGIEPLFTGGDLWLGMMPGSAKGADLRRDPRLALHAATVDKEVTEGDAKLAGRALLVDDEAWKQEFLQRFADTNGTAPEGPYDLFRVEVTELVSIRPAGDHLDIDVWVAGRGTRRIERR